MQKKVCIDVLVLTSVKSAGRCKQDKGCLELTKALPGDHGSTPYFLRSLADRKKQYAPLIFMRVNSELDLRSSIDQRQFLPQRCYSALL